MSKKYAYLNLKIKVCIFNFSIDRRMLTIIWQYRVAINLQFAKIIVSVKFDKAKHNKTSYTCIYLCCNNIVSLRCTM